MTDTDFEKLADAIEDQSQEGQPGRQVEMKPTPDCGEHTYRGNGRLEGLKALITGGDSGIGRAAAIAFAREGADVAISYHPSEEEDAAQVEGWIEKGGGKCVRLPGDVADPSYCESMVERTVESLGGLGCLVNNAAQQYKRESLDEITPEALDSIFRVNVFSAFHACRAAERHLQPGSTVINSVSVVAYKGSPSLLDYSATKGALVAFTRGLAARWVEKKIRVNMVAPGPVWTPLQPPESSKGPELSGFGEQVPMGRAGQPVEMAGAYVYLASGESSYVTGQCVHANGGMVLNG